VNSELLERALKKRLGIQYATPRQANYFRGDELVDGIVSVGEPKPILDAQKHIGHYLDRVRLKCLT